MNAATLRLTVIYLVTVRAQVTVSARAGPNRVAGLVGAPPLTWSLPVRAARRLGGAHPKRGQQRRGTIRLSLVPLAVLHIVTVGLSASLSH